MNMVDNIEKRNARAKVEEILKEIATGFECPEGWMKSWGPRFMGALVGKGEKPEFTAEQIGRAFETLMETYKYNKPPKPAHIAELARELRPLPALQKAHTDPTPGRKWTDAERAANIARMDEIMAYIEQQNKHPDYVQALARFGRGSAELAAVVNRQTAEMQDWLEKSTQQGI